MLNKKQLVLKFHSNSFIFSRVGAKCGLIMRIRITESGLIKEHFLTVELYPPTKTCVVRKYLLAHQQE